MNAPQISSVTNATDIATQTTTADAVVEVIRTGGTIRPDVERIRAELQQHGDKKVVSELKKQLPGVLWSGTFTQRSNAKLVQHSGLLCADLDGLNGNLSNVREQLQQSRHVWALFLSPSGDGLKAVFRVPADAGKHAASFRAVEKYVHERTGKQIDQSCKDPARLCFLSYDPAIYHNANAPEIEPLPDSAKPKVTPSAAVNLTERQCIAAELLGTIEWQSDSSGFAACPGKHLHTRADNVRDCGIDVDGVPTVHCFHNSCRGILDGVNHELRSRTGKAEYVAPSAPKEARATEANITVAPRPLPWLLHAICEVLQRYVVFQFPEQPIVIAVWVAHTWALDAVDYTPYLHIFSAETSSGKSRLLEVLAMLVNKPWKLESVSVAALFRRVEKDQPTLLYDESDNVFRGNGKDDDTKDLRACLNSGFTRGGTFTRCVGQNANLEVKEFATFSPKALSGIGKVLSDTLSNRCIPIELVRQTREEKVHRFRQREVEAELGGLQATFEAWAQRPGVLDALRAARPALPEQLSDRQQDISEPLLAIADMAGESWPELARNALVKLCKHESDVVSRGIQLLGDLKAIFGNAGEDKLTTRFILAELVAIEQGPWALMFEDDLKYDRVQSPASRLAKMLRPYKRLDGNKIEPRVIKLRDGTVSRGYCKEDFGPAWERYLPPTSGKAVTSVTRVTTMGKW